MYVFFVVLDVCVLNPASTLYKSNIILPLYLGNLGKLLSANIDGM